LAAELGASETAILRGRGRDRVQDRPHTPKRLTTRPTALDEALVCELRGMLALPFDDIGEVMRRCVRPDLSHSAIHRCLCRHGMSRWRTPTATFEIQPADQAVRTT
jgi:hypothetical protein